MVKIAVNSYVVDETSDVQVDALSQVFTRKALG